MKYIICFLTFLTYTFSYSQNITGELKDKQNNPIKGARIGIENTEIGDLTDENGNFQIDFMRIDKNSIIKVQVSEFQAYRAKISEFINSNHKIVLNEKVVDIEPIIINPKKYKMKNFGTSNSKRAYCGYDSGIKDKIFREYAILVKNNRRLKIKKINVNIVSANFEDSATLIFDIQNSKNGFPDDMKSLTNETLKVNFTKDDIKANKISLDVDDKNIWTNDDFFVTMRVDENFKGRLYFGGNIFAFSKDTFYRNFYGEWKKFSVGEPSINVDVQIEK